MNRTFRAGRLAAAAAVPAVLLGLASPASAGSIQQPGLTTGLAEGYGLTEGLYSVTAVNLGSRATSPESTLQNVAIPLFLTWSTPWDIGSSHVSFKAAPLVGVSVDGPGMVKSGVYSPYVGAWFSWYLGGGYNLSLGEGAQVGVSNDLTKALGRDYTAFQQNVALSYVRHNWNITGNLFYTQGRTRDSGSQPDTLNLDFTAIKRDGRMEYGVIGYTMNDLNSPSVGYLGGGKKQSEVAVGGLVSYLVGNLMSLQLKLTTDVHQSNLGGRDTRLWVQLVMPLWTPEAPSPRNAQ